MKTNLFICIIGIDGSGKTTLAKEISESYSKKGILLSYVYNRYLPLLMKPIILFGKKTVLKKN